MHARREMARDGARWREIGRALMTAVSTLTPEASSSRIAAVLSSAGVPPPPIEIPLRSASVSS